MTELLTAAQMRAIETAAIESGEVTGLELMERAGQGVVEAIFEEWPEMSGKGGFAPRPPDSPQSFSGEMKRAAVVLCGPGNNGGDGFVVARLLHERGWRVEVFLFGDAERLPPDARSNYERWCALGDVVPLTERAMRQGGFADLYVDAIFGTGLTRGLEGELFQFVRHLAGVGGDNYKERLVSIDAPSGLCLDSGRFLQQTPPAPFTEEQLAQLPAEMRERMAPSGGAGPLFERFARLTVCFDSPKPGHFLAEGPDLCGKVVVKDIGISKQRSRYNGAPYDEAFPARGVSRRGTLRPAALTLAETPGRVQDERRWGGVPLYCLTKHKRNNKFGHGHALILSGGAGKTGAARMTARGALRIGAGLVTLGVPPSAQMEVAAQVTAIMLQRVPDAEGLTEVLRDKRLNALCLGPALGLGAAQADLVRTALESKRACVLDADALTLIAQSPELFEMVHDKCVLTPHGGEFARLFPDIANDLSAPAVKGPAYSKVDATRTAAARIGATVLFKGPDTVIATPDGQCSINAAVYDRSAPWLATAGSGDVLAGFITGLLARGLSPKAAAETAAWLHVECARSFGPGLIAEDLPKQLPKVFRRLEIA